jgi:hypothetical protein
MATGSVTVSRVEIRFDTSRTVNRTVLPDEVLIDGKLALQFAKDSVKAAGTPVGPSCVRDLEKVLPDAWEACSKLESRLPGELVFRDAADRVHEAIPGHLWSSLTTDGFDQQAFDLAARIISDAHSWEHPAASAIRDVHQGTLMFYAAASSFRMRNADRGILFLEAGMESDRVAYARVGKPGGEVDRPGALTLLLVSSPANAFSHDVNALRAVVDTKLIGFSQASGEPPGDPLRLPDFEVQLLRDPASTAAAKLIFAELVWTHFNVNDPAVAQIAREGEITKRRHAELLLDLLTASEVILREVEGTRKPRENFVNVVARIYAAGWTLNKPSDVAGELVAIDTKHADQIGNCLDFWNKNPLQSALPGAPWYVPWIEQGRYIRNRIAHQLETTGAITSRWLEVERVAWFSLFAALWLRRQKNPKPILPAIQYPSLPFPATSGSISPILVGQPSGIFGPPWIFSPPVQNPDALVGVFTS